MCASCSSIDVEKLSVSPSLLSVVLKSSCELLVFMKICLPKSQKSCGNPTRPKMACNVFNLSDKAKFGG
jgi:hypothetical protein